MADLLGNPQVVNGLRWVFDKCDFGCKQIGLSCNAYRPRIFTKAECDARPILCGRDIHEKSLKTLLKNGNKLTEAVVITALAEHLLVNLAPEQSCTIDKRYQDKSENQVCKCGCGAELKFGNTGIADLSERFMLFLTVNSLLFSNNFEMVYLSPQAKLWEYIGFAAFLRLLWLQPLYGKFPKDRLSDSFKSSQE